MKYFINCKTKEEAKAEYRKLAKTMHPDAGGDGKNMVELQKQYESFEESRIFGSENAFRESIYDKYRGQNSDSPYFRTYTFNAHSNASYSNQAGELQRLRDENTKLRSQLYQYESVINSNKKTIEQLANQHHILVMEIAVLKGTSRHIRKQNDELSAQNNELITTYPKTAWATIKHLFKLLGKPFNEYA